MYFSYSAIFIAFCLSLYFVGALIYVHYYIRSIAGIFVFRWLFSDQYWVFSLILCLVVCYGSVLIILLHNN